MPEMDELYKISQSTKVLSDVAKNSITYTKEWALTQLCPKLLVDSRTSELKHVQRLQTLI